MYATFKKLTGQGRTVFRMGEKISLFGCNEGWIPWLLKRTMPQRQGEPFAWHLNIQKSVALDSVRKDYPNVDAIIVDIKPTAKNEFFVCELEDIYGYSSDDWTPLLWRMKVLQIGSKTKADHLEDFEAPDNGDTVYEFLNAQGSVKNGQISGSWNPPKPSPTNGALLWPEVVAYFIECITGSADEILGKNR